MTYDSEAKKLAVKAIGTVESNLNYRSINYNDPITVGIMQWYGVRAAEILYRIINENAASWVGVPDTLTHDLTDTIIFNDSTYWPNRYLTQAEGEPLRTVLDNNHAIQDDQATQDLGAYLVAAQKAGMSENTNTQGVLFFFVMYHQSPRRALGVIASAGPLSDIDRLYAVCLNEPVLGQYRTRYTTARDIIKSGNTSGVGGGPDPVPVPVPDPGGNTGSTGQTKTPGVVKYVQSVADQVHIRFVDGHTVIAVPNGRGWWIPSSDVTAGAPVPPIVPPVVVPDPGSPIGAQLVAWMLARLDLFAYSQGASRLLPYKNMYTDCSGLVHYCYSEVAGIEIGTYTGNQYSQGTLVAEGSGTLDESLLQLGDLIFFDWKGGGVDHVDMYSGNGNCVGHGGPDAGPNVKALAPRIGASVYHWVRRHV